MFRLFLVVRMAKADLNNRKYGYYGQELLRSSNSEANDDERIIDVSIHPHQEIFIGIGKNDIVYYNHIDQHVNK